MTLKDDIFSVNESELMEFYKFKGILGKIRLRSKLLRSWILHKCAYSSIWSENIIRIHRIRGVTIGKNCHISPYVLMDLVYPQLIEIGHNVTIGSNVMIFAHINPTANLMLKKTKYPRTVAKVIINDGAVINPGAIITSGITIGKNSLISVGSVVVDDVPDNCVVVGNPARVVKKLKD